MQQFDLFFESSPWFIFLCVVAGIVYSAVLYYKSKTPWTPWTNIVLAVLRFLFVFVMCLLLLGPLVRQIFNSYEQPVVILALDNSESISEVEPEESRNSLLDKLKQISVSLNEADYRTEIRTFDQSLSPDLLDSVKFDSNNSDVNLLLRNIQNDYESRNLAGVVLFSDGIYNQGSNPLYQHFNYKIYTVGLGDTTQKPDLVLNNLVYNKIAYQGNKFPLVAELFSVGYQGQNIELEIRNKNQLIERRVLKIDKPNQFFEEHFLIEAKDKGYQQFRVIARQKENELSLINNQKDAFVDIIEGKEKILISAPFPHPDIKAIRSALSENKNYEVQTYIEGIDKMPADDFDVYILHQIPNKRNTHLPLLNKIGEEKLPVWYILGSLSHIPNFNSINGLVEIQLINNQTDDIFPYFNKTFTSFLLNEEAQSDLRKYPPVSVPFANYSIRPSADVLLFQRVGSIETGKPLLLLSSQDHKQAVLIGNGTWQWRLAEYGQNESTDTYDELVTKTIQFLSAKDDKRKFKVYPIRPEFFDNESVVFETEAYNNIYERIYGQEVSLVLKNENGESTGYQYITSEANSRYAVNNLPPGVYQFEARSNVNGINEIASGAFIVKEMQIEQTQLRADHQLMRNLAAENGGTFYPDDELDKLLSNLSRQEAKSIIHSQEDYLNIINLKWLFFLIILLFSIEWFLRKYHGSY